MKRALFVLVALLAVASLTGCATDRMYARSGGPGGMGVCRNSSGPCNPFAGAGVWDGCGPNNPGRQEAFRPGPPSGAVTYPYYTVRGPRDFLAQNPRPIGP